MNLDVIRHLRQRPLLSMLQLMLNSFTELSSSPCIENNICKARNAFKQRNFSWILLSKG